MMTAVARAATRRPLTIFTPRSRWRNHWLLRWCRLSAPLRRPSPGKKQLKSEIENTDSDFDREKLQERLAKLAGGVAVGYAGPGPCGVPKPCLTPRDHPDLQAEPSADAPHG
jgi:hypothetical protein